MNAVSSGFDKAVRDFEGWGEARRAKCRGSVRPEDVVVTTSQHRTRNRTCWNRGKVRKSEGTGDWSRISRSW
jgi:hypothetical protein